METNAFNEIFDSETTEEVSLDAEAQEASLDEQRNARRRHHPLPDRQACRG